MPKLKSYIVSLMVPASVAYLHVHVLYLAATHSSACMKATRDGESSRSILPTGIELLPTILLSPHLKLTQLERAQGGVAHPPNEGEVGAHFYNLGAKRFDHG